MKVTADTTGLRALIDRVEAQRPEASLAMARGVAADADEMCPEAAPDVPGSGNLRRSQVVRQREDGSAEVAYLADHAIVTHNKPGVRYYRGRWQYLRDPLMAAGKRLQEAAAAMRRAFE